MKSKFYLSLLTAFILGAVMLGGCKKKDDPEPTRSELFTNKNWRVTAWTSDPAISINGVLVTNVFNQMDPCSKDDLFRFNSNGVYTFDEGASKCNTNDPQTTTGTWSFNSDQTIVSVTEAGGTTSYNIESVSESTLKANTVFNDGNNNYTWSFTYTKN